MNPPPPPSPSAETINTKWEPIMILYVGLACLQVIITILPGVWYARTGVATPVVRRALSIINYDLVFPAVYFTSIASQVTATSIVGYWTFAVNAVLTNIVGLAITWALYPLSKGPKKSRNSVIVAGGFGSLVGIPLLITSALCSQDGLVFYQVLGSQCQTLGWSYSAVAAAAANLFTYPLALFLLSKSPEEGEEEDTINSEEHIISIAAATTTTATTTNSSSELPLPPSPRLLLDGEDLGNSFSTLNTAIVDSPSYHNLRRSFASSRKSSENQNHRTWLVTTEGQTMLMPIDGIPMGEEDDLPGFGDAAEESTLILSQDPFRAPLYNRTTFFRRKPVHVPKPQVVRWMRTNGKKFVVADDIGMVSIMQEEDDDDDDADNDNDKEEESGGEEEEGGGRVPDVNGAPPIRQKHPSSVKSTRRRSVKKRSMKKGASIGSRMVFYFKTFRDIMVLYVIKPPLVSSLLGILFGVVEPLQNLLYPITSAPLGFISGAINNVQAAIVFTAAFVLGAVMSKGPGPGVKNLSIGPCVLVLMVRMVILPIVGPVIVIGSNKLGIWKSENPIYYMLLVLMYACPTGNQVQNLCSILGHHEEEIGAMIFFQYLAMIIMLPFWCSVYVALGHSFNMYGDLVPLSPS